MTLAQRLRARQAAQNGPSRLPDPTAASWPTQDPDAQERPLPEWLARRRRETAGMPLRAVRDETPKFGG